MFQKIRIDIGIVCLIMVTLYDFNSMDDNQKANAVWAANYLGDRQETGLIVQLYDLTNFYVEVYYDNTANKIMRFRSFKSTELLVPYLAHIKFNSGKFPSLMRQSYLLVSR